MKEKKEKFWLCWNPRKGKPLTRHTTEQSAITESERLSNLHPGHHIYVLEMTGVSIKETPSTFEYVE